ncbi:hypothetical protein NDU88_010035 [Pleurodeles waltl]|uniref:Uncharacterized protein n=1 Tax=Pleurodeles waltl TaxID=8319 RepID=A0AAV7RXU1_PLEWA|nr:hypothetical protein NDU88_010035 [Pleurodeles waltl]
MRLLRRPPVINQAARASKSVMLLLHLTLRRPHRPRLRAAVRTGRSPCAPSVAVSDCLPISFGRFTRADQRPALAVFTSALTRAGTRFHCRPHSLVSRCAADEASSLLLTSPNHSPTPSGGAQGRQD